MGLRWRNDLPRYIFFVSCTLAVQCCMIGRYAHRGAIELVFTSLPPVQVIWVITNIGLFVGFFLSFQLRPQYHYMRVRTKVRLPLCARASERCSLVRRT